MSATWCDSSLAFQETLVREAIDALAKDLDMIEQSVVLTSEVNEETRDDDSYDRNLPQKIERFREYLERLRAGVAQLTQIQEPSRSFIPLSPRSTHSSNPGPCSHRSKTGHSRIQ